MPTTHPIGIFSSGVINCRHKCLHGLRHWSYIRTLQYNAVDSFDYVASVTVELMGTQHWWNNTNRRKPKFSEKNKPVPVPLLPPQIPHWLVWDQTRVSKLRGKHLAIQATAWLQHLSQSLNESIQSIHSTTSWSLIYELVNRPICSFSVFPVEINPVCNLLHNKSINGQVVPLPLPSVLLLSMNRSDSFTRHPEWWMCIQEIVQTSQLITRRVQFERFFLLKPNTSVYTVRFTS
jgi:hypothetical protein